ncbi:folate-binding protein [Azospirillum brasilense]|uniref:Folate-binding protein n=1 Tax=Azospirillum brasilense TaxID=192 RepID=A0A0P0E9G2_AZOBR|nr:MULTISPECIES: folate-binding protein YgfZ [Azospirillum]ALJ34990.1 glycine cleavage system protein T [Azospirillum brasilense]MDW7553479.1 folate-binding protein YgfZ [Azospirillum brasilense]MDW7594315.1 folate-binding protein YgfZ [Azospirillum brasilense]MDW7629187.1 folate-binding protein YgfZ [Azospirillum brasilense]MDX5953670.1 folate-binding protein YgfZ [Azospirillum brasilense]
MTAEQAGYAILEDRGVIAVAGEDRAAFLQGLVSNDLRRVAADRAVYALFLTPQGKFLHDFRIAESDGALLLDPETDRREEFLRRLKMYKLRSKITLEDRAGAMLAVVLFGGDSLARLGLPEEAGAAIAFAGGIAFTDPRLPALGARAFLPRESAAAALEAAGFVARGAEDYDRLRLSLGVPEGSRDLTPDKALPLENDLDDLNAISWDKGCYMGQELTARTKYRALIKKKLFPVTLDGPLPAPGTPVTLEGKEVGEIRSGHGSTALALLRLEDLTRAGQDGLVLTAGEATVTPAKPVWASF